MTIKNFTKQFPVLWLMFFALLFLNVHTASGQTFVPGGVSQIEWPFAGTPTNNHQGWTIWNGSGYHTNDDYHSQDWGRTSNGVAVCGDNFYSPISGTIKYIERNYNMTTGTGNQYGNCVYIQSNVNPDFLFLVAHLATVPSNLAVGNTVSKRTVLGTVGRTGCCAGNSCHAHMTLYNGPITLLSSNGYYTGDQSNAARFNVNNWTATPTPSLSVNTFSRSFSPSSGTKSITVTGNVTWTASDNRSWISVSPSQGGTNGTNTTRTVNISVQTNTGSTTRTGTVTISGGGITRTVGITQSGANIPTNMSVTATNCGANFSWSGSGSNWYIDVWETGNSSVFYHKPIPNVTSTTLAGLVRAFNTNTAFVPVVGRQYSWRLWNGSNSYTAPQTFTYSCNSCPLPPAQGGGWPQYAIDLTGQSAALKRYDSRHNPRLTWHNGWCGYSNVSGDTWFKFRVPNTGSFTFRTEAGDLNCTTNMGQAIVRMFWTNNGNSDGSDLNYYWCASPIANNNGRQMPHIWFQAQGHNLAGKWVYFQVVGYGNHQGVFRASMRKLSNSGLVADNPDELEEMAGIDYEKDIDTPDGLHPSLILFPELAQAVEEVEVESTLRVFPNPATNTFFQVEVNYNGEEEVGQATVLVKNLNGQTLQRRTVGMTAGTNLFEVDSSNLPNGAYLTSVVLPNGKVLHQKTFVQK